MSDGNIRYDDVYRHSLANPEDFWGRVAEELHWYRKWDRVLDDSNPPFFRWFVDGQTNLCYNAVDRHVLEGRAAIGGEEHMVTSPVYVEGDSHEIWIYPVRGDFQQAEAPIIELIFQRRYLGSKC